MTRQKSPDLHKNAACRF